MMKIWYIVFAFVSSSGDVAECEKMMISAYDGVEAHKYAAQFLLDQDGAQFFNPEPIVLITQHTDTRAGSHIREPGTVLINSRYPGDQCLPEEDDGN